MFTLSGKISFFYSPINPPILLKVPVESDFVVDIKVYAIHSFLLNNSGHSPVEIAPSYFSVSFNLSWGFVFLKIPHKTPQNPFYSPSLLCY